MKTKSKNCPGKSHREGISLIELYDMFPDEPTAEKWFEDWKWGGEVVCPHCGSHNIKARKSRKPQPYWCRDCRKTFSVRVGTQMENSRIPLRKWAIGIYLYSTSLNGVSSMKLHRDLKITQKSAWFMLHRLREASGDIEVEPFSGPVEVDETYMGGKRKNMSNSKRKNLTGRGPVGKTAVVGMKDREANEVRAKVVDKTDAETLHPFIVKNVESDAMVYTDDAKAYDSLDFPHESVKHSVKEYVRDQAHTNGIESFWAMLKRGYHGTYHHMSKKHLNRYIKEFANRHNVRDLNTLDQMVKIATNVTNSRLKFADLIAKN